MVGTNPNRPPMFRRVCSLTGVLQTIIESTFFETLLKIDSSKSNIKLYHYSIKIAYKLWSFHIRKNISCRNKSCQNYIHPLSVCLPFQQDNFPMIFIPVVVGKMLMLQIVIIIIAVSLIECKQFFPIISLIHGILFPQLI